MNSQQVVDPLFMSRIVWASLSFSMLIYGFALYTLGKLQYLGLPETYSLLEIAALAMGLLLFVTLIIHEKKIRPEPDMQKRFPLYVVCWAVNELIVVVAFVALFTSGTGNGFIYLANFTLALTGNLIMLPKKYRA